MREEHLYLFQPPEQEELQEEEVGHIQVGVGEEVDLHQEVEEVVVEVGLHTLEEEEGEEEEVAGVELRLKRVMEGEGEELPMEHSDWLVLSL